MRAAICSGSFDPITLGHYDIIQRAAACFDKVWVCVSPNAEKRNQMFTPEQKLQMVQAAGGGAGTGTAGGFCRGSRRAGDCAGRPLRGGF